MQQFEVTLKVTVNTLETVSPSEVQKCIADIFEGDDYDSPGDIEVVTVTEM